MKILQIVPSISLVYGGPSQMVLGLSQALATEGIDVTILTTNSNGDAGQPPLDVPLAVPVFQEGYQILYFPCSPFRRYKFSAALLRWLASHAHEYDLAHIHALFSPVSTFAAIIARIKRLPYILRPLGTLDPADLQKKRFFKQLYGNLLEKPNLSGAAAIHFTTDQEAKISERYGVNTRDLIIPLGVNIKQNTPILGKIRASLNIKPDIPLILFMSRIDPKKGLNLLLASLDQLAQDRIQFHFVLAGSNPQDADYEQQIRHRVETSVWSSQATMTGFVQGEFKLGLLQDADVFVLPSAYENFGIAVAEAMAVGTPVIISKGVYLWPDVQQAQAGWIISSEVDSLTETLKTALNDPSLRQQRGENARTLVQQQYTWGAIARQMILAYEAIVKNYPPTL